MEFTNDHGALVCRRQGETLRIEPWGQDALRIRATEYPEFTGNLWALSEKVPERTGEIVFSKESHRGGDGEYYDTDLATITNGRISAVVNFAGVITFRRDGKDFLREYYRNYGGSITRESHCLKLVSRDWIPYTGGDYKLHVRFESNDGEKIFGMGQYQQPYMDMKGCVLELAQKNSQTTVPFAVSNLGYGFLWNNPAVGKVSFGKNLTEWTAEATKEMDYWITVADTPKEILANYTDATGHAPMMPEDRMGLWQCKLRYRTQDEVLSVAREYKRRGIPLDVIVIDFFHWTLQGDWTFDKKYWPDPKAMCDELHSMGIKVVVSVWPSVDRKSVHFGEMVEKGLLMRTERGAMQTYDYQGDCVEIDPFNPATRQYVWDICKKNYYDYGIDMFWLDNSEPDLTKYDFDNFRYYAGPAMEVSNLYPQLYSRIFYDNEIREGNENPVNLLRSGWAGSQKYGNVLWSGDVPATFESFRDQLAAGLSIGLAGIPWWTTDIGGFMEGNVNDPYFHQLLIRWYEFAVFSAVLRMHGDREPFTIPALDERDWGGGYLHTGQPTEIYAYGEDNYKIMRHYLDIRLEMKPYIRRLYEEAHENGSPLIRTMFYEFPEDAACWDLTDQYMFGSDYLVAPILYEDMFERDVYLPAGKWQDTRDGKEYEGGTTVHVAAPLESIPVFWKL
ncbi:alpha-D-xyloside xylohydrolase [Lachnospiraceae bacterium NK3A20]|nr:alpha-D-xyloside xylohydrolase [Lachnospiraceae bacterium NK3A20]